MVEDDVNLVNQSDEPITLEPGEEAPVTLLFDPQVRAPNIVHVYSKEQEDGDGDDNDEYPAEDYFGPTPSERGRDNLP